MEYLTNVMSMQTLLDNRSVNLQFEVMVKFAIDICKGVNYCHEQGILHLDIKPANVLVCSNGICKLCDFGSSIKINGDVATYEHKV